MPQRLAGRVELVVVGAVIPAEVLRRLREENRGAHVAAVVPEQLTGDLAVAIIGRERKGGTPVTQRARLRHRGGRSLHVVCPRWEIRVRTVRSSSISSSGLTRTASKPPM